MGISVLLTLSVLGFVGTVFAQDEPVAVSVARNVPETDFKDPLGLPELLVDFGDAWDRFGYKLTVPNTSTYMFQLNAGANAGQKVNMNLRGGPKYTDVYRGSTSHNGSDTAGRLFISPVNAGDVIYTQNERDFELYSDVGRQTSFTAIDVERFLSPVQRKIFSVARRTDFNTIGKVQFDETLVNVGGDFDDKNSMSDFAVKRTGIHFFTFSAGVKAGTTMRAQIKSKDEGLLSEIWEKGTNHNGTLLVSKCIMADLFSGDSVYIELLDGEIYSDGERQTTFGGFFYDPVSGPQVAWSVYSVVSNDASVAAVDPYPFHGALVNTGPFDFNIMHMNITQSGLYFVQLCVHAQRNRELNARVVSAPEFMEFSLDRTSTSHNDPGPVTNGMLVELFEGNYLKVQLGQGSYAFSDADRLSSFTGFLVYPFPEA